MWWAECRAKGPSKTALTIEANTHVLALESADQREPLSPAKGSKMSNAKSKSYKAVTKKDSDLVQIRSLICAAKFTLTCWHPPTCYIGRRVDIGQKRALHTTQISCHCPIRYWLLWCFLDDRKTFKTHKSKWKSPCPQSIMDTKIPYNNKSLSSPLILSASLSLAIWKST